MESKTLIGKNSVLFLINDSSKELEVHCDNLNLVSDPILSRYTFKNYFLFIYPNKSLIYKDFLPDKYVVKYRPAFNIYKSIFKDKLIDLYEILKNINDVYYKTDTHINIKGNYIVYEYFIKFLNQKLNLKIIPKNIELNVINCELNTCNVGIGDLTWDCNLGKQILLDKTDNYYYNDILDFYCKYKIQNDSSIRFLTYRLEDKTELLEDKIVDWNIISEYIIYNKNNNLSCLKIIIFYDSLLLSMVKLYLEMFNEIYLVKNVYSNELIDLINPDFVFEFRVERFLF